MDMVPLSSPAAVAKKKQAEMVKVKQEKALEIKQEQLTASIPSAAMSRWDVGAASVLIHNFNNPEQYYKHWNHLLMLDEQAYISMIQSMDGSCVVTKLDDGSYRLSCSDTSKFHASSINQLVKLTRADGKVYKANVVRYHPFNIYQKNT